MENAITKQVRNIKFKPYAQLSSIPATVAGDVGCERDNDDFALRCADLMMGANSEQFEGLVGALAQFCAVYAQDTGDEAYLEASASLRKSFRCLRLRKSC